MKLLQAFFAHTIISSIHQMMHVYYIVDAAVVVATLPTRRHYLQDNNNDFNNNCDLVIQLVEAGSLIENYGGNSVLISSNGQIIVTGDPAVVLVYNTESKEWNERSTASLNNPNPVIGEALAISDDGTFLIAQFDSTDPPFPVVRQVQYSGVQTDIWNIVGVPISVASSPPEIQLSADATILATNTGNTVLVRQWQASTQSWIQLGNDVFRSGSSGKFIYNLSLSDDGTIVAFVVKGEVTGNNEVHILQYNNNQQFIWTNLGQIIIGENEDFGYAIALSGNGRRIAITEAKDSGQLPAGIVRVYEVSEIGLQWERIGQIIVGESLGYNVGSSVALSFDGSVLIIGANGGTGRVYIYTYNSDNFNWILQDTITVQHTSGRSRFGSKVTITPDATYFATNSIGNGAAVYVYSLNFICPTPSPIPVVPTGLLPTPLQPVQGPISVPTAPDEPSSGSSSSCFLGFLCLCFSSMNLVQVKDHYQHGMKYMNELQIGDYVAISFGHDDEIEYSRIISFTHKDDTISSEFLQIYITKNNEGCCNNNHHQPIEISHDHLIRKSILTFVRAKDLQIGDILYGGIVVSNITSITRRGLYAPVTETGTIVVSGVMASNYVAILDYIPTTAQHYGGHALYAWIRWRIRLIDSTKIFPEVYGVDGISENYVLNIVKILYMIKHYCHGVVQIAIALFVTPAMVIILGVEQLYCHLIPVLNMATTLFTLMTMSFLISSVKIIRKL